MERKTAVDMPQLIDQVGCGADFDTHTLRAITIILWDGRKVVGTYCTSEPGVRPDVKSDDDVIWDDGVLRPFIEKLLKEGASFVTETGESDTLCDLRWTIEE
jgi:hypothetical protein